MMKSVSCEKKEGQYYSIKLTAAITIGTFQGKARSTESNGGLNRKLGVKHECEA